MSSGSTYTGACLCGAVRWQATGSPYRVAHCHCEMCRRTSGAAFTTGASGPAKAVSWKGREPSFFQSSPDAKRGFCAHCGSWLSWHFREERTMMTIGSFDQPDAIQPEMHTMAEAQISWLKLDDGLPRYARWPADIADVDQGL